MAPSPVKPKRVTNLPVPLPTLSGAQRSRMMVAPFQYPEAPYRSDLRGNGNKPEKIFVKPGPVYLPRGAANVAWGKPVTSSDALPVVGNLAMLTDGNKAMGPDSHVELGPYQQWVQIDLQGDFSIHGVLLWHYFQERRIYRDVIVQLADDEKFTRNVRTVYNNDQDNSSGLGVGKDNEYYETRFGGWIPVQSQTARYVRLYSRGSDAYPDNQYIEVEVWATLPGTD